MYQYKIFLLLSVTSFECHHQNLRKQIMQVRNLNGDCRTNIDKLGNVFRWGFSVVSQHNLLEVPSGVINANNTEPLGDH